MEPLIGAARPEDAADSLIRDADAQSFVKDVLEGSKARPVLVDFWATWCAPCKQLTPLLEKLVLEKKGRLALIKVDIDKNREIAAQLQVQSVPTVYAFYEGRPVDAFQGALPESQLRQFIEQLLTLAGAPESGMEDLLAEARQRLDAGESRAAIELYSVILQSEPEHAAALGGMAEAQVKAGRIEDAKALIDGLSDSLRRKPEIEKARAAIELAVLAASAGDLNDLAATLADRPDDHQARFELAKALAAHQRMDDAATALLDIIRTDREWNDGAARRYLLKLFEAAGPADPFTLRWRRRLSAVLFS